MSFLTDIYAATARQERADLQRIEVRFIPGRLLSGMTTCAGLPPEQGMQGMEMAFHMMFDQSIRDQPEPWPYQYVPGSLAMKAGDCGIPRGWTLTRSVRLATAARTAVTKPALGNSR